MNCFLSTLGAILLHPFHRFHLLLFFIFLFLQNEKAWNFFCKLRLSVFQFVFDAKNSDKNLADLSPRPTPVWNFIIFKENCQKKKTQMDFFQRIVFF